MHKKNKSSKKSATIWSEEDKSCAIILIGYVERLFKRKFCLLSSETQRLNSGLYCWPDPSLQASLKSLTAPEVAAVRRRKVGSAAHPMTNRKQDILGLQTNTNHDVPPSTYNRVHQVCTGVPISLPQTVLLPSKIVESLTETQGEPHIASVNSAFIRWVDTSTVQFLLIHLRWNS